MPFPAPVVKMIGGVMASVTSSVTAETRISDKRDGYDDFLESF
ncbi:MAG: hypothetical protein AB4057_14915 [Crocosphaera sp.]